jgi:cytidine deaminase
MVDKEYLRAVALSVRGNAYAPYSGFTVGAAVEMEDGTVFGGANVENAAYPQTICAERSAIVTAISAGHKEVRRVYVVADPAATPCGGCRSVIAEHGSRDTEVIIGDPRGEVTSYRLEDLLRDAFEFRDRDSRA